MKKIAVVHPFLSYGGGAEGVSICALSSMLKSGHEVTILSCDTNEIAINSLLNHSRMFESHLEDGSLLIRNTGTSLVFNTLAKIIKFKAPLLLAYSCLIRELKIRRHFISSFDLIISTVGEIDIAAGDRQICYIHYPTLASVYTDSDKIGGRLAKRKLLRKIYNATCRYLSGFKEIPPDTLVLTNSNWTSNEIRLKTGYENIKVIYPPAIPFSATDLQKSPRVKPDEYNIVNLGRLVTYKGQDTIVRCLTHAAENSKFNGKINVTFIGRGAYADEEHLLSLKNKNVDVKVIRNASREQITEILKTSDFSISAFKNEHFGMATAELFSTGIPVFVPGGGGQTEVPPSTDFIYNDEDELTAILEDILNRPEAIGKYRDLAQNNKDRFSVEIFERNVNLEIAAKFI